MRSTAHEVTPSTWVKRFAEWIGFGLCVALLVYVLYLALSPVAVVYKSFSNQTCVRVDGPIGYSCKRLPDQYETVWIK